MGIFQKLISIFDGMGSVYETSSTTFRQIDLDKAKKIANLEGDARVKGLAELPAATATSLDSNELRITTIINDALEEASELFIANQRSFEDRIATSDSIVLIEKIDTEASLAETDCASHLHLKDDLYHAKLAVLNAEASATNFKQKNNLERNARNQKNRNFFRALIPLIVIGETTFNAAFFAAGSALGLIGGWFVAAVFAIVNVTLGLLVGHYSWRYINHVSWPKKIFGIVSTAVLFAAIFVANLVVAHYRTAMMSGDEMAEKTALQSFINGPFDLTQTQSWFLLIIGCICALAAAADVFWLDDPYPGFGAIEREQLDKTDEYTTMKLSLLDKLEEIRDRRIHNVEKILSDVESNHKAVQAVHENYQYWKTLYRNHLDHLQNAADTLMAFYRDQNRLHRKTPAPSYFDEKWKINRPEVKEVIFDLQELTARVSSQMKKAQDAYTKATKKINNAYKKTLDEYLTIDELQKGNIKCETVAAEKNDTQAAQETPQAA